MTENVHVSPRNRAWAEVRRERLSDALNSYAEEQDRADAYLGIVFRSGPAGRRAGIAGGPDIWEICWLARQIEGEEQIAERLTEDFLFTPDQVAVALRYAAEFPEEIEARIDLHQRETAHYESLAVD